MTLTGAGMATRLLSWLATVLPTLAVILYPLIVHSAVQLNISWLVVVYLGLVSLLYATYCLYEKKWLGLISMLVVIVVLSFLWRYSMTSWLMFMAPVIIFAFLAYFFGRTLLPGRTPLITTIARIMSPQPLHETVILYTKTINIIWFGFFCIMCIESLLLALFAPLVVWSYMTNFVNYLIVASLFLFEYVVRKWLIKQDRYQSFYHFISTMLKKRNEIKNNL